MPKKKNFFQRNRTLSVFLGLALVLGVIAVFGLQQSGFQGEDRIRHYDDHLPRVIGQTDEYVEVKNDPRGYEVQDPPQWTPNDLGEGRSIKNGTISLTQKYSSVGPDDGLTRFSGKGIKQGVWYPVEDFSPSEAFSFYLVTDFEEWTQVDIDFFNKSARCKVTNLRTDAATSGSNSDDTYSIQGTRCQYKFSYEADEKFTGLTKDGVLSSTIKFPRVGVNTDIMKSRCFDNNDCSENSICNKKQQCEDPRETFWRLSNGNCDSVEIAPSQTTENDYETLADCELAAGVDIGGDDQTSGNDTKQTQPPETQQPKESDNLIRGIDNTILLLVGIGIAVIGIFIAIFLTSSSKSKSAKRRINR